MQTTHTHAQFESFTFAKHIKLQEIMHFDKPFKLLCYHCKPVNYAYVSTF